MTYGEVLLYGLCNELCQLTTVNAACARLERDGGDELDVFVAGPLLTMSATRLSA